MPAGYTNATFTAQTYSGQQITTSKQVLNIPFSAKVPGRLHFLMDKGFAYPDLARLEASKPSAVTLGNTTTPLASSVKLNLASRETAGGEGQLQGPGFVKRYHHTGCSTAAWCRSTRRVPPGRATSARLAQSMNSDPSAGSAR